MKLSILLVVLNNKAFIAQAMDNFLAQSCPDAELLVMDGASTDGGDTLHLFWFES
jgi:glycosyltransferase involved in cell wall biosynthesis